MKLPRTSSDRLTIGDTVHLIAILSAASFAISGVTHFLIFTRQYRFNYFAVASPSDIVIGGFVTFTMISIYAVLVAVVLSLGIRLIALLDKTLTPPALTFRNALRLMAIGGVIATANAWYQSIWGDAWPDAGTGLVVASDADIRAECQGADVAWVGSHAAIVACMDGVRIFRDLAALPMVPWLDQFEAEGMKHRIEDDGG